MRQLKKRLYTVSTLVPHGARVADIGTDHGFLPIYLTGMGISPYCIACDIKEKPLASAKENIAKIGFTNIEARLGNGLEPILPNEVDCITIAGMGGEVISSILDAAPWVKDKKYTLILQPMTSADSLRGYLCENGFTISRELACEENHKVYTVMQATYSGECFTPSELFRRIGMLKRSDGDTAANLYIEKQIRILKELIDDRISAKLDTSEFEKVYAEMTAL